MSDKETVVKQLAEAGYQASLESGLVMVYYERKEDFEQIRDEIKVFLQEKIGYRGSYGIKGRVNTHESEHSGTN